MAALLVTLPSAVVTPLLTAQPAAAAATGSTVCRQSPEGVFRWNGGTSWTQISERGTADQIYGGGAGLLRAAPDGSGVYRYQGSGQNWEHIGTAGPGSQWVVTDNAIYGRSPDGVFRWNGGTSWTQISERGTADQIYGGGAGLLRAAPDGSGVYRYQGSGQNWQRIGTAGPGSQWVVTDNAIYGRSPDGVFRWNGGTSWTQISERGTADQIYGGGAGLLRAAPDGSGVYRYQGSGQNWQRIGTAGPGSQWVVTDNAIYGRSPDGVFRWNGGTSWTQISERGTADRIAPCAAVTTAVGWTTYSADSDDGKAVLEICAGSQWVCTMTYTPRSYRTFPGPEHPVGDSVFNYTSQTETHTLSWSDTVESSDTLEVSSSAKATIWGVAELGVSATYSHTWGRSSSVSETESLPVPGCSVGWLARAAEMGTASGDIHVHFAKGTHLDGHRDFMITNAVFTAPTGSGSIVARSRPVTASESTSCP
ncbi:hypothetical protein [Streptomyces marianii]|uniref:Peptidase M23 domain-containing protein n=1 Tax=Streptomyces marianii TaxID=1817406 RepID=A0A5R9E861_9ACTN|nr:hypothetical protein [Streptomyces marianii]TLQ45235.1 hypothetical protein FEF34_21315 [Streptomyces marianii]